MLKNFNNAYTEKNKKGLENLNIFAHVNEFKAVREVTIL
jgi:hypothetical protein